MQTKWMMFQCGGGARWTSAYQDYSGEVCSFSGCDCGAVVRKMGETEDRDAAAGWFRRPEAAPDMTIDRHAHIEQDRASFNHEVNERIERGER